MDRSTKAKRQIKNVRDQPSEDNFFVPRDKSVMVKQFKEKIQRMFEIKLKFEEPVDDGQWLVLQGEQGDRRNAKNYINAIIQPDESQQIKFPDETCNEFINPQKLEQIEKQTNAIIKPLKNIAEFEICGTELAVTLALSMMEDIAGNIQKKTFNEAGTSDDNTYLSPTCASERLTTSLQRALSDHSDGACTISEYSKAPEAVKRVLVECLEDDEIEDDLLFAGGESRKVEIDLTDDVEMDTDGVNPDDINSANNETSPVGKLGEKLTDTVISTKGIPEKTVPLVLSKQQEYLKSFGATVGYKPEEVIEALHFVDDKTRPSDFLDLLQSVTKKNEPVKSEDSDDEVIILETSTVDLIDGSPVETIDVHPKVVKDKQSQANNADNDMAGVSPYKRDLPDSYKERLIRDFMQEDRNCSVEELKKRNAERQRMLQQNFKQQQHGSSTGGCESKKQMQSNSKKEAGAFVKQKGKSVSAKKAKQDKRGKDSVAKENPVNQNHQQIACGDFQNDMDQTCVMRPWVPGESNDCVITGQSSSNSTEDQWKVPKRRKPPVATALTAPVAERKGQRPPSQSPNRVNRSDYQKPQGPPQSPRGQGGGRGKPVQIVSPTNVAMENRPLPPLPDGEHCGELRYIVIDGSNVALTHGKGSFSSKGIQICVDYFKKRGHKGITVFLPRWRKQWDDLYLQQIQDEGILTLTPSRKIEGKLYASYDDRFILRLAEEENGIIVSNDNFRDIMDERANWKRLVHSSLLMYCFAGDHFMPPEDPLGRDGPQLDEFLRKPMSLTPPNDNATQELQQQYQRHTNMDPQGDNFSIGGAAGQGHFHHQNNYRAQTEYQPQGPGHRGRPQGQWQNRQNVTDGQTVNIPNPHNQGRRWNNKGQGQAKVQGRPSEPRSDADSESLYQELKVIFPEDYQEDTLRKVLSNHPWETDLTKLTNYCMSVLFP